MSYLLAWLVMHAVYFLLPVVLGWLLNPDAHRRWWEPRRSHFPQGHCPPQSYWRNAKQSYEWAVPRGKWITKDFPPPAKGHKE